MHCYCDPMDYSPPGSSVREIFQARLLEWVAISFSRGSFQPRDWTQVSWTAGRFFTDWATREAIYCVYVHIKQCIYVKLIHFAVHLKLTQHCKSTIFQFKTRNLDSTNLNFCGVPSICSAAAAAKSLQSCPTLCDPIDGSHQGSPSLGFSRQEHWSGLPFPSPMRESKKWKWICSNFMHNFTNWGLRRLDL